MSITFSLWTSPFKKKTQYIYGPLTYWFQTDQTHLLYGSSHGGHSSSLGPGAAHTGQILGHWNRHLGAPLLYKVKREVGRHRRQLKGAELRGSEYSLAFSSRGKRTFEKRCTVLSRMTSLGRDFTPLTEQCRKQAPPSISTSPVTWYTSSPIWKKNMFVIYVCASIFSLI